jgi:hypothetical protein
MFTSSNTLYVLPIGYNKVNTFASQFSLPKKGLARVPANCEELLAAFSHACLI